MDLLIYCSVLLVLGFVRIKKTSNEPDAPLMVSENSIPIIHNIPLGSNLGLKRISGAYTAILKEMGLDRC
jgi:hypothetical protein